MHLNEESITYKLYVTAYILEAPGIVVSYVYQRMLRNIYTDKKNWSDAY